MSLGMSWLALRFPLSKLQRLHNVGFKFFLTNTFVSFEILGKNKWCFDTKIVLTYCEKKCSSDREKLLKFKAEGQEFTKKFR